MSELKDAISKLKDFEAKVVAKAMENDDFRKKLIDDPKGALSAEAGKDLPEGLNVKVQEEDANSLTIVLPPKAAAVTAEGELSAEALKKVAGGGAIADFIATVIANVV